MLLSNRLYPLSIFCLCYLVFLNPVSPSASANSSGPNNPPDHYKTENWSSCEEFLANATFDALNIIDIDWKLFYFWSLDSERSYNIRFSVPSKTLVQRFEVELADDMTVNWTAAELFMESTIDFSALFFKTNVSGLYYIVPSLAFEYRVITNLTFAMKYVEPGYLGIMNCKYRMCYALAPVDKMPRTESEADYAASKMGFRGDPNYSFSYLKLIVAPVVLVDSNVPEHDDPDDDDLEFDVGTTNKLMI